MPLSDLVIDGVVDVVAEPSGDGPQTTERSELPERRALSRRWTWAVRSRLILTASRGPERLTRGTGDAGSGEPAVDLMRRLLTGRTETTYTCGGVSCHVDGVTDVHLALPESVAVEVALN